MILYYALGGGLGHLSRSLAILQELPRPLVSQFRLLTSSRHSSLVIPSVPCPVNIVAGELLTSRRAYCRYLKTYLERHLIDTIILDTFPFGIVGEWLHVGLSLPRLLIARSLKWDAYQERIRHQDGAFPQQVLVLETLSESYYQRAKQESQLTRIEAPITLAAWGKVHPERNEKESVLIVHSGDEKERETLQQIAEIHAPSSVPPDCIFPEHGLYPAERVMARYSTIVAAAGYNMVAIASQAPPGQNYILHPFHRRFDDQFLRLQRFKLRQWPWGQQGNGREEAARWLAGALDSDTDGK